MKVHEIIARLESIKSQRDGLYDHEIDDGAAWALEYINTAESKKAEEAAKKVDRPKHIDVLGRRVSIVDGIPEYHENRENTLGLWEVFHNRISLRENLPPDQERATLVHELCHDIEQVCGICVSEQDIASFSSVLFAVMRANPGLVSWLMSK